MALRVWAVATFCLLPVWAQAPKSSLDYPLALKTRWTYHLRQENGPGVTFGDTLAPLAKGNIVEATVVSEAAGVDTIGGRSYTRVETRLHGEPFLFEWERLSPEGLLVGKTVDYQQAANETVMVPEQKRIGTRLQPGNFWYWQAKDAPVRFRYNVLGPGGVSVPAGRYEGVHLNVTGTVEAPFGKVEVRQDSWFVPGIGIVRQETDTGLPGRRLSHITLTLEKFEKP